MTGKAKVVQGDPDEESRRSKSTERLASNRSVVGRKRRCRMRGSRGRHRSGLLMVDDCGEGLVEDDCGLFTMKQHCNLPVIYVSPWTCSSSHVTCPACTDQCVHQETDMVQFLDLFQHVLLSMDISLQRTF